jgi:uncharacterized protein
MTTHVAEAFGALRTGDATRLAALLDSEPGLAAARDESGVSLVMLACYHRRQDLVGLILARQPTLDIFEAAALPGHLERGKALLEENPALATAFSADGFTPLHLAAYFGNEPLARLLLDRNADPDAVSKNSMALRPLHSASASGSFEIVRLLVERRADVNAKQSGGFLPLHTAADRGHLPMIELFLQQGANPSAASDDGTTPIDLAERKGHKDAVERLLRAVQDPLPAR